LLNIILLPLTAVVKQQLQVLPERYIMANSKRFRPGGPDTPPDVADAQGKSEAGDRPPSQQHCIPVAVRSGDGQRDALAGIQAKRAKALWHPRIPLGECTTIDGDPATNKSSMALDLAARVSVGAKMPEGGKVVEGGVVLLVGEHIPCRPPLTARWSAAKPQGRCEGVIMQTMQTFDDDDGKTLPEYAGPGHMERWQRCSNCPHCRWVRRLRAAQRRAFGRCAECGLWYDLAHAASAAGLRTAGGWAEQSPARGVSYSKTWGGNGYGCGADEYLQFGFWVGGNHLIPRRSHTLSIGFLYPIELTQLLWSWDAAKATRQYEADTGFQKE
jgi:hypothetical protein